MLLLGSTKIEEIGRHKIQTNFIEFGCKNRTFHEIYIHGWPDSHKTWSMVMESYMKLMSEEELALKHIILIDLPGFGGSEKLENRKENKILNVKNLFEQQDFEYTTELYLDFLEDLIKEKVGEGKKVRLVGNSMGAVLSRMFAEKFPVLVEKIIMFGGSPYGGKSETLDACQDCMKKLSSVNIDFITSFQTGSFLNEEKKNLFLGTVVEESMKVSLFALKCCFWNVLVGDTDEDEERVKKRLEGITSETFLIHGEKDEIFPVSPHAKVLEKEINKCILVEKKGWGHCCNWDIPEESAEDLKKFLEK